MAFCGDTGVLVAAATSKRGANGNLRSQRSGEEGFHPGKLDSGPSGSDSGSASHYFRQ